MGVEDTSDEDAKAWARNLSLGAERDRQQRKKDAEDAARYRWLREHRDVLLLTGFFGNGCINRTLGEVDAEIDAAMKTPNVKVTGLAPEGE